MTTLSPAFSLLRNLGGLSAPTGAVRGAGAGPEAASGGSKAAQGPERRDRVEISDEAKALQAAGRKQSPEEQARIQELQVRDAEVRAHEGAHSSVGGALAGAPSFEYQKGPDGRLYAVGGEVPIQVQSGATPQDTLAIAAQVRAAALAPAQPSSADMAVAASATSLEMQARNELAEQRLAEVSGRPQGAAGATGNNRRASGS